jgi:hypothetical protein
MLEADGVLRTWALEGEPRCGRTLEATHLADHRTAYLDYEGPVSGNRGDVRRMDYGQYELVEQSSDEVHVQLMGATICCRVTLRCVDESAQRWTVTFSADRSPSAT